MKHLHSTCGPSVETEWRVYEAYLLSLKARIPPVLLNFALVNSHDARIMSILRPSKSSLSITVSGFAYEELKSLTFTVGEVIRDFAPGKLVGQALWGHEVTWLGDDEFEIRAKTETNELFVWGKQFEMTSEPSGCRQRRVSGVVDHLKPSTRRA